MQPKSKTAAGLFGILLGSFGVHNFYLGYIGKAILQICLYWGGVVGMFIAAILFYLSILLFFIPLIVAIPLSIVAFAATWGTWIWCMLEGIFILTGKISCDARGIPLE